MKTKTRQELSWPIAIALFLLVFLVFLISACRDTHLGEEYQLAKGEMRKLAGEIFGELIE